MQYKALISDVDGTLVTGREGMPSAYLKETIGKAQDQIFVGIATARPYAMVQRVIDDLALTSPCILGNGVQIYDPVTHQVLVERTLPPESLAGIYAAVKNLGVESVVQEKANRLLLKPAYQSTDALYVFVPPFSEDMASDFEAAIATIPNLTLHKMIAWDSGRNDYLISHQLATKQHAVLEVAKILEIDPSEIIGVGDGYNDFHLLSACGLKVAMGNAVDDLKAMADYIAPSVEDDGVADVINKFILKLA